MWADTLNLGTASGIVAVLAHLALAVVVLPQFGQHRRRALRLEAALLLSAVWAGLDAAVEQGWLGSHQWPALVLLPICDALRYGAWFSFILALIESRGDDLVAADHVASHDPLRLYAGQEERHVRA